MALDLNDPELEFSDLVYAYQSWVMAVINDEKLDSDDKLLTDDIAEDALNSMRFPARRSDQRHRNQPGPRLRRGRRRTGRAALP